MNDREKAIMACVISIIVPAYNAEKYIARCINSVISQTYPYWQLIVVDDGSIDHTSSICLGYIHDERILYHQKLNGGVSSARNLGLSLATGDYILFLDADDFLCPECFETCVAILKKEPLDVLQFGHKIITEALQTIQTIGTDYGPVDSITYIQAGKFQKNVWCTLTKSSVIQSRSILFDETIRLAEDQLFVLDVLQHSNRVQQIAAPLYNYVQLPSSSAHHLNTEDTKKSVLQISKYKCIPALNTYLNTLLIQMTIDYLAQKGSSVQKVSQAFMGRQFSFKNPYGLRYRLISVFLSINISGTLLLLKLYGTMKFMVYTSGRPY